MIVPVRVSPPSDYASIVLPHSICSNGLLWFEKYIYPIFVWQLRPPIFNLKFFYNMSKKRWNVGTHVLIILFISLAMLLLSLPSLPISTFCTCNQLPLWCVLHCHIISYDSDIYTNSAIYSRRLNVIARNNVANLSRSGCTVTYSAL